MSSTHSVAAQPVEVPQKALDLFAEAEALAKRAADDKAASLRLYNASMELAERSLAVRAEALKIVCPTDLTDWSKV